MLFTKMCVYVYRTDMVRTESRPYEKDSKVSAVCLLFSINVYFFHLVQFSRLGF